MLALNGSRPICRVNLVAILAANQYVDTVSAVDAPCDRNLMVSIDILACIDPVQIFLLGRTILEKLMGFHPDKVIVSLKGPASQFLVN